VKITNDRLGQGSCGLVYRGMWPVNNDEVTPAAFKKASIMCSDSEFEKEIALLRKLDHAYIVKFYGITEKESIKYK
jgi:serine/threonine protein kinase